MPRIYILLAAVGVLSTASAQSHDVSGTWSLRMEWADAISTGTCVFEQKGTVFTGTCGDADRFQVSGTIEGTQVRWQSAVTQEGFAARLEFSGEIQDARTIRGTCVIPDLNVGTCTLSKR